MFLRDLRFAARLLLKTPAFTTVVALTIALAIAANTAVFSLVNAALLRPLPYQAARDLVLVTGVDRGKEATIGCLSYPRFALLAAEHRALAAVAAFAGDSLNLTRRGEAEQVSAAHVSWNFFQVLGVSPALGRPFVRDDEAGAASSVAIVSDRLWRRKFGAAAHVAGQSIALDARAYEVVGVLPASFEFGLLGNDVDVWLPRIDELSLMTPEHLRSGACYLNAVGRLTSDQDVDRAQAEMNVLNRRYLREYASLPDADPKREMRVTPLRERLVADLRPMLLVMTAAVAFVLLIACANVAALFLARGLARRRELSVRTSLGATRAALAHLFVAESLLVTVVGALIGTSAGLLATNALGAAVGVVTPGRSSITAGADVRVLAFVVGVSVLTALFCGLVPALQFGRANPADGLREGDDRAAAGSKSGRFLRRLLLAVQVGLSVVLLVGAGLLIRTFWNLQHVRAGFEAEHTLTTHVSLPPAKYVNGASMVAFYQRLIARIEQLPGVQAASLSSALPLNPSRMSPFLAEGQTVVPVAQRPIAIIQTTLGDYVRTLRIPVLRGRPFYESDRTDSPPVVIINETLARRFFGHRDPVGRHIWLGRRTTPAEIVGVIGDVRNANLATEPQPEIEVPFGQLPWPSMNLTVRTRGDAMSLAASLRAAVAEVDADQPVTRVQTLEDVLASGRARSKAMAALLGVLACSALVLAVVGLYGLVAYWVSQRTREIGVRMAMGASRADVVRLVVRQNLVVTALGIAGGTMAALALTRSMSSLVYNVATTDFVSFAAGPALLLVGAVAGSWLPARRAARIDPAEALRAG